MKEKLIAELKQKYTGQLTSKFIETLAERLIVKVEKEEDIEGVISELDNSPIRVQDLQVEGDRRATDLKKKIEELEARMKPNEPQDPPEQEPNEPNIDFEERFKEYDKRLARREAMIELREKAKEAKIPSVLISDVQIDSPEQVDEVLEGLREKTSKIQKEMISASLVGEPPKKPTGGANSKEQVRKDIEANRIVKQKH